MKVLSGIPTKNRKIAGRVADVLSVCTDKVIVVSENCDVKFQGSDVEVFDFERISLMEARNFIAKYGVDNGYDIVIQSDDDLMFSCETVQKIIRSIEENEFVGSCSSISKMYANWAKNSYSNSEFFIVPFLTQLWGVRSKVFEEIGYFCLETAEDLEFGMRCWDNGWAVVRTDGAVHNVSVKRVGKGESAGGQSEDYRNSQLPISIDFINKMYLGGVIKWLRVGNLQKITVRSRYNWDVMTRRVTNRWGDIGYSDSNGRRM